MLYGVPVLGVVFPGEPRYAPRAALSQILVYRCCEASLALSGEPLRG
jgi:hypothetical protein